MSRKQKENSFEVKLEAVKLYLEKNIESTTIAKKLGLTDGRRVMLWVKRYKKFGEDGLKERREAAKGLSKGRKRSKELTLKEENIRLKAEVEYLKKLLQVERL
ncbi:MAG: helix-turn-helix domain-containing protein [Clostridium sp.]|uniref:helix-turn-helix domain-containing protein n=1 Tax=Clostridium sp. TaxID=1506 RepID=UPI003F3A6F60